MMWSSGATQTLDDKFTLNTNEIPIISLIQADIEFPVKVQISGEFRKTQIGVRLIPILRGYIGYDRMSSITTNKTNGLSTQILLADAKKLSKDDFDFIKEMMEDFVKVFGVPDATNSWRNPVRLESFIKMYRTNRNVYGRNETVRRMKYVKLHDSAYSKFGTSAAAISNILPRMKEHMDELNPETGQRYRSNGKGSTLLPGQFIL